MENGMLQEVVQGLKARKGDWKVIAVDLAPDVSYSMIARLGRGTYGSSPTVGKLEKIAAWLRDHPMEAAAQQEAAA